MKNKIITGEEAIRILQYTEYGDFYIKALDIDFINHEIRMLVDTYIKEKGKGITTKYLVRFKRVSRCCLKKAFTDEEIEVIGFAELFYTKDRSEYINISEEERRLYDFVIDADPFEMFIKGDIEMEEMD